MLISYILTLLVTKMKLIIYKNMKKLVQNRVGHYNFGNGYLFDPNTAYYQILSSTKLNELIQIGLFDIIELGSEPDRTQQFIDEFINTEKETNLHLTSVTVQKVKPTGLYFVALSIPTSFDLNSDNFGPNVCPRTVNEYELFEINDILKEFDCYI